MVSQSDGNAEDLSGILPGQLYLNEYYQSKMPVFHPKCLRSALYARNPAPIVVQHRMDTAHKARYVDIKAGF